MIQVSITLSAFGTVIILILLLSCIFSGQKDRQETYFTGMLCSLLVILVTDSLDWLLNGNASMRGLLYVTNSLNYIAGYVILTFFGRYLGTFVKEKQLFEKLLTGSDLMCLVSVLLMLVNLFGGIYFRIDSSGWYQRGSLYWLSQFYPTIALILFSIVSLCSEGLSRKERLIFFSYSLFPFIGIGIDYFTHGISFTYTGAVISVLLIYIQIDVMRGKQLIKKEAELSESRIKIMLSQIQPHFLYNVLSTIRELCRSNPEVAEQATIDFSDFLRGNMDSLFTEKPVLFEQELDHTKNYIALEQLRFEERLKVIYRIHAVNFSLPSLTLQPIVENAVRYGVTKKTQGGTIIITTEEKENCFEITVEDDGVGFEPNAQKKDGRVHIGIQNVQERLSYIGGELRINSVPEKGTVSVITIWK